MSERAVLTLSAALEVFHAAALVHDDIIDNSDTRRGMPATHIRFAAAALGGRLRRARQTPSAAPSAILHGDLLLGWSDELVDSALDLLDDRQRARSTRAEFNRMRTEVTVGQYLDILEENAWPTVPESETLRRAERVMTFKSAKYSVEAPLALGALVARSVSRPGRVRFAASACRSGWPSSCETTCSACSATRRSPESPPETICARESAPCWSRSRARACRSSQRAAFDRALGDPGLDDHAIADLQRQIESSGALESAERSIESYTDDAIRALSFRGTGADGRGRTRGAGAPAHRPIGLSSPAGVAIRRAPAPRGAPRPCGRRGARRWARLRATPPPRAATASIRPE